MPLQRIKDRLQILLRLAVVCVVTLYALHVTSLVLYPKNNQPDMGMVDAKATGFLGEPKDSIDVLFLGDSEAYSSFVPLLMWHEQGFTSYVCSTPGQKMPQCESILKEALACQKPKIVVIETNMLFSGFSTDSIIMRAIQEALPVFEYHDSWKCLTLDNMFDKPKTTWTDGQKGYLMKYIAGEVDASNYMTPTTSVEEMPAKNEAYLKQMIAYCKESGATPIFVSTPSTVNWNTARHNTMEAWSKEAGIDYIDYNLASEGVGINWQTDSRDNGDHLNHRGAVKLSKVLGKRLAQDYKLPDHRDDPQYAEWNRDYARAKNLRPNELRLGDNTNENEGNLA